MFSCKWSLDWWGTDVSNTHENLAKNQSVTELHRCGKCGAMGKNVEGFCCDEMEAVEYYNNYWLWGTVM